MNKDTLKLISINRDAVSVNLGFYYQYLHVLQKWVENYIADKDEIVQTEVGDDIKQVGGKLIFTQVKSYTSTFSWPNLSFIMWKYGKQTNEMVHWENINMEFNGANTAISNLFKLFFVLSRFYQKEKRHLRVS